MKQTNPSEQILDCESLDSALISLSGLLGVKKRELKASLKGLEPKEVEANPNPNIEWNYRLWNRIVGPGTSAPVPRVVHWFHATRVLPETNFKEGLLPLNLILPTLAPLPGSPRGEIYQIKTTDPRCWGPYAFLVRDAIVRRASVTHDFLEGPEILDDYYGHSAIEFRAARKPCIVKFRSIERRPDVTRAALSYCYSAWVREMRGEMVVQFDTTGFNGEGRTVPRSDIIGLEYPKIIRYLPRKQYSQVVKSKSDSD